MKPTEISIPEIIAQAIVKKSGKSKNFGVHQCHCQSCRDAGDGAAVIRWVDKCGGHRETAMWVGARHLEYIPGGYEDMIRIDFEYEFDDPTFDPEVIIKEAAEWLKNYKPRVEE